MKFRLNAIFFALFISTLSANAEIFFTGEAAMCAELNKSKEAKLRGYLTGQLNFTENIFIRTEVSLKTGDLMENGLFEDNQSAVKMGELSLTYAHPSTSVSHFLSLFIGEADSIGKDSFLRHQFAISSIASPLLQSYTSPNGLALYPLGGYGGSVTIRLANKPLAGALYVYNNTKVVKDWNEEAKTNTSKDKIQSDFMPNIDLRFATVTKIATIDIAAGIGIPLEDENSNNEDAFLVIKRIFLHAGATALIGSPESRSIFMQVGFENLEWKKKLDVKKIDEKLFLFLEPRMKLRNGGVNLSVFNIPQKLLEGRYDDFSYQHLTFIGEKNTLGANLMIYTDKFVIRNSRVRAGLNLMFSLEETYFKDISIDMEKSEIKGAPFLETELLGGFFGASLQASYCNSAIDVKAIIGYKKTL